MTWLSVGLGGFVGAILRYGISRGVQALFGSDFPAGTLVVNLLGCLAIGAALGVAGRDAQMSEQLRLTLVVGLLGSFTTFSTFAKEAVDLFALGQPGRALLVVAANLALGLPAVWLGARLTG